MSKVKVGIVQMSCSADKEANLQKAIEKVKKAAAQGAQGVHGHDEKIVERRFVNARGGKAK